MKSLDKLIRRLKDKINFFIGNIIERPFENRYMLGIIYNCHSERIKKYGHENIKNSNFLQSTNSHYFEI